MEPEATASLSDYRYSPMIRSALNNLIIVLIPICCTVLITAGDIRSEPVAAVQQEAERGKYQLIDAETLWDLYQDDTKNILLIDTRQEWEYRTGHITEAISFSMEPTWFDRLIQRHALAQVLGPDKELILVFY